MIPEYEETLEQRLAKWREDSIDSQQMSAEDAGAYRKFFATLPVEVLAVYTFEQLNKIAEEWLEK